MRTENLSRPPVLRVRLLGCGAMVMAWGAAVQAQPTDLYKLPEMKALERTFVSLADQVRPSVVALRTYRELGPGAGERNARVTNSHGSGVILRSDGMILTNEHVLADADFIKVVLHDGSEHDAQLIQRDVRSDMAIIKIEAGSLKPAVRGDAADIRVGQWCFAVGNPFGVAWDNGQPSVTRGNISALGFNLTRHLDDSDTRYYGDLIQTDSAINPGNSGGPLFNIDGQMIGLVTAIVSRSGVTQGLGFAIPMDMRTRRIIDALMAGQAVRYGYLGVSVDTPRRADGASGALITQVNDREGPAARANLQVQDVIVEFDGVPIRSSDHLVRVVGATPVGTSAHVRFVRSGQPQELTVTVAERPGVQASQPVSSDAGIRTLNWRGAVLAEMDDESLEAHGVRRADAGIVVVSIDPTGESRAAGLKPGEVILAYNSARVRTLAEFMEAERREARGIKLGLKGGRTVRMRR